MRTPSPSDREYCRRTLPRVSRTFALNIRLLSGRLLEAVRTAYLLCRAADTLEDSWPGPAAELDGRFAAFLAALAGDAGAADGLAAAAASRPTGAADVELLASLPVLLRALAALDPADAALVADGVRTLAAGMRRYAVRAAGRDPGAPYLDDDAELGDYCYVVAGCVGEMLTRLAARGLAHDAPAAAARRLALAPAVGEALQLTNIVLDWPADVRRGRCHVPAGWLAAAGLAPADLVRPSPAVRALAQRLAARAHAALDRVPDYLDLVPRPLVRYRMFCLLPALWARASLHVAARDPEFPWGARRPRLSRARLWREALRGLAAAPSHRAARRALLAPAR